MNQQDQVGIRELRQNLSVYLRRVANGETLEVTDHGTPVALLSPLPAMSGYARLVAAGKIARGHGRLAELPPPLPAIAGAKTLSEILEEMRAEERY